MRRLGRGPGRGIAGPTGPQKLGDLPPRTPVGPQRFPLALQSSNLPTRNMPFLRRIATTPLLMPKLVTRTTLAIAIVGGFMLFPSLAQAQPDAPATPTTTTPSSTTTTAPVPVTLTPAQTQQMSALQVQITQTGAVLDQLAQTYETDSAQLGALQQHEASIQAQIASTQRKVAAARKRLRTDALIAYMGGVPLTDITAVPFSSTNEAAATSEYQQVAIANTAAVAAAYEAVVHTLAAEDATLVATETKVQAELTDIAKAQQSAVVAASTQQASLVELSTGNDPSVPAAFLATQTAGRNAVDADRNSAPIPPVLNSAVWAAASEVGVPYVWGGETPLPATNAGFDCSGLVQWAYAQAGIVLPRTAQQQHDAITPVPAALAQPGDLVFWNDGTTSVQHVAIYVGAGIVLEAPSTGSVVSYAPLWPQGLVGFGDPTVPVP
jgi:cell wall-associated NlpC family hydrolase